MSIDISEEYIASIFRVEVFATCLHAGLLFGLFFDPEVGCDMFLRNFGSHSTDYTAL
jgi:hypothetical protein